MKGRKRAMLSSNAKQWMLGAALAAIVMSSSFVAHAQDTQSSSGVTAHGERALAVSSSGEKTNINLAVASNFYGVPPLNSAITDLITAFKSVNPDYTVTVVDHGATATLASHIIDGNELQVDLFLAADTATPLDLLINHFDLVAPYNSSLTPPLYTFNYATGILALLSNTPGVDLSCETGTCGYNPNVYATVAIADPNLAPFGVAAQTVLTGRYGLIPPLSSNSLVHEYPNITATFDAVIAQTDPVGFVALAAICSDGNYPTSGTSALVYLPIENNSIFSVLIDNYNPITQSGIAIRNARTTAQNAELGAFVAFLTDFTTSPSPDSPMMTTLKKYCYSAP
jgi:ABC-type molybdate transport system substrate-binding protein